MVDHEALLLKLIASISMADDLNAVLTYTEEVTEQLGWPDWTAQKELRRLCQERGITTLWGTPIEEPPA